MILGLSTEQFTILHVVISLIGLASGLYVVAQMLGTARTASPAATAIFLATTIATSATGFFFRTKPFGPAHAVGVLSLAILAVALLALYAMRLKGGWRLTFVVCCVASLYLNVFVAIVQAFQKLPTLQSLAPTQSEPPFVVVQALALVAFIAVGVFAARRFQPSPPLAKLVV